MDCAWYSENLVSGNKQKTKHQTTLCQCVVVKNCLGNPMCLAEQPEGFGIFSQTEKTVKRPSVTLHSRKFKLWVFYMFGSGPVRNMFEYIAAPFVLKRSWDSTPMGPLYQWNLQCTNALFQKTPSPCSNKFPFSLNKNVWKMAACRVSVFRHGPSIVLPKPTSATIAHDVSRRISSAAWEMGTKKLHAT